MFSGLPAFSCLGIALHFLELRSKSAEHLGGCPVLHVYPRGADGGALAIYGGDSCTASAGHKTFDEIRAQGTF